MKRINVVVVLFLMLGWSGCRENSGTVDIVTVDISQNYPKMLEQPREMGEMTLKDFVPMSLRCQMRSNRKSGKCKEKQNIAGERFANHYPRRCKI